MTDYGLTASGLAKALGVSRQTVNELHRERRAVSPEMVIRLARLFGNTAEFWLNAQRAVDLWDAEYSNSRVRLVTADGIIRTVAGNGIHGFGGDGGPATAAQIMYPCGVAADSAGNFYIAEVGNNRIRKITPDGLIQTFAGKGGYGFGGDGGPATAASLSPSGVAVDSYGNLYIPDYGNSRVRKITPAGVISTVAGKGTYGYSGDSGPATEALLHDPQRLAFDSAGNLYIADTNNSRVRKVTPEGIISTVAGCGEPTLLCRESTFATETALIGPTGVAIDSAGNLYITDYVRVLKVTLTGTISTIAGRLTIDNLRGGYGGDGGPATEALLRYPQSVAVDSAGNIYIADQGNRRIRKITAGGIISTVAGNGTSGDSGDGGLATEAPLNSPIDVEVDSAGNLYIADSMRVLKVTAEGIISTVAGIGTPYNTFDNLTPSGIALDREGNLFISNRFGHQIFKLTAAGAFSVVAGNRNRTHGFSGDNGPATEALLDRPSDVELDFSGNLYIADNANHRVRKIRFPICSSLDLSPGGAASCRTAGTSAGIQVGYAKLTPVAGDAPYGTAVFSFRQDRVTVSEAGVPASPPTTRARIFVAYRKDVNAVPGRNGSGIIDVNTGIAIVNTGPSDSSLIYRLRDENGWTIAEGTGNLPAGKHIATFIDQLHDIASNFNLPSGFQFGSLEVASDQPVSILALRGTMNQRNEFLMTTTPVADLTRMLDYSPVFFPQFADGGGYTTSLFLMNTSSGTESGTFQILGDDGNPFVVNQAGGKSDAAFRYSIPAGGAFHFQTDGFPAEIKAGWVRLIPESGTATPVSSGIFSYNQGDVLVSESGIPSTVSTNRARVYVDLSGYHNTGLAIANLGATVANVTIKAYQTDGVTEVGTSFVPLPLVGNGHAAKFVDQIVSGLPPGFTGILDISSSAPFAALTLRSLINERNEFLMATFPVADLNRTPPSPVVFPHVADGGGYITEFILINPGQATSTTLSFYDGTGLPTDFGK